MGSPCDVPVEWFNIFMFLFKYKRVDELYKVIGAAFSVKYTDKVQPK